MFSKKEFKTKRSASSLVLAYVLMGLAATGIAATDRTTAETTIERPTNRATAFVPRLGKREQSSFSDRAASSIERMLCANSPDCSRLALLGALVKGVAVAQEPSLRSWGSSGSEPFASNFQQQQAMDAIQDNNELNLYDMIMGQRQQIQQQQQPQLKREPRASDESSRAISELLASSSQGLGAKRVAFTPRIG